MTPIEIQIENAVNILLADGIVAMPTETVYGLAARISSQKGISKIFEIKERPFFDPLIVHISNLAQLKEVTAYNQNIFVQKLMDRFWPGPLSIILPKHPSLNPMITSGLDTVAVRMPNNKIALDLITKVGEPLAAPSANKFSKTSPTTSMHVRESFKDSELFVIEGEDSEIGIESTVIRPDFSLENEISIEILRPGFISKSDIENAIGSKFSNVRFASSLASPGNIEHHYMPDVPLVLVNKILTNDNYTVIKKNLAKQNLNIAELVLDMNEVIAARQLYSKLRDLSQANPDIILFAVNNRSSELWAAIFDRIKKAATFNFSSI